MGRGRQRRKELRKRSTHHVFPRSRCKMLGVDSNAVWNKIVVNAKQHELYHELFFNMTPREILDYLLDNFWNGMIDVPDNLPEE